MFGPAEPLLYPGDETLERSSRTQFMADYLTGKPMIVRYDPDAPTGRRDLRRFL